MFLAMMVFKMCFCINEHLVCWVKRRQGHWIYYCLEIKEIIQILIKLYPLYNAFLPNTKRSGWKIRTQFNSSALVKKQNNSRTKIVNALWFRLLAKKSA